MKTTREITVKFTVEEETDGKKTMNITKAVSSEALTTKTVAIIWEAWVNMILNDSKKVKEDCKILKKIIDINYKQRKLLNTSKNIRKVQCFVNNLFKKCQLND